MRSRPDQRTSKTSRVAGCSSASRAMLVPSASDRGRSREERTPKSRRPSCSTTISPSRTVPSRHLLTDGGHDLRERVGEVDDLVGLRRPPAPLQDDPARLVDEHQAAEAVPLGLVGDAGLGRNGAAQRRSEHRLDRRGQHHGLPSWSRTVPSSSSTSRGRRRTAGIESARDVEDVLLRAAAHERGNQGEQQLVEQPRGDQLAEQRGAAFAQDAAETAILQVGDHPGQLDGVVAAADDVDDVAQGAGRARGRRMCRERDRAGVLGSALGEHPQGQGQVEPTRHDRHRAHGRPVVLGTDRARADEDRRRPRDGPGGRPAGPSGC